MPVEMGGTTAQMEAPDLIIDGVAYCYNHSPDNYVRKLTTVSGSYAYHLMGTPAEHRLTESQWARDWQPEEFMDMMLLESTTDLICMHSVPLFDYAKDGFVSNEKGAYLKQTYPDRVLWYAALDLGEPSDRIVALLDEVVAQGADGINCIRPARTIGLMCIEIGPWMIKDLPFPSSSISKIVESGMSPFISSLSTMAFPLNGSPSTASTTSRARR